MDPSVGFQGKKIQKENNGVYRLYLQTYITAKFRINKSVG